MKCEALTGRRLANPELGIPDRHTGDPPYRKTAKLSRAILPTFGDTIVTRFSWQSGGTVAAATLQCCEEAASPVDIFRRRLCIVFGEPIYLLARYGQFLCLVVQATITIVPTCRAKAHRAVAITIHLSLITSQCGITAGAVAWGAASALAETLALAWVGE